MLIRPRLTDHYGIQVAQNEVEFAIPFLDEDIPLYVDPFLMWRSPSMMDRGIHQVVLGAFNHLGGLTKDGQRDAALAQLIEGSECDEVGLGTSRKRKGVRLGRGKADAILQLFERIDYYRDHGFRHIEEVQLFVEGFGKDRISDLTCNYAKSFLIDFTADNARRLGLPTRAVEVPSVYDVNTRSFAPQRPDLPVHPETGAPILLVPKRWLRHTPWIGYDSYFRDHCPQDDIAHEGEAVARVEVLQYNAANFGAVDAYVRVRERTAEDCESDPLFSQIPVLSARRKLAALRKLPTGKTDGADRAYEDLLGQLLPSLLYPSLDFAQMQARTDSGVSIRDLIFYNTRATPFLEEIIGDYGSRQITVEMKNVAEVQREHVDQVNRYLTDELGKFGVIATRHQAKRAIRQRLIDLWSGQRRAVIVLTDEDIAQMVEVFESKQRDPLDVVVKKYVEFRRTCP